MPEYSTVPVPMESSFWFTTRASAAAVPTMVRKSCSVLLVPESATTICVPGAACTW